MSRFFRFKLEFLKIFLKSLFLLEKRGKDEKKLAISETAGYPHTLFIDTLTIVFEGHRVL